MSNTIIFFNKFTKVFFVFLYSCCFVPLHDGLFAQEQDVAKPHILIDLQNTGQPGHVELIQPVQVENLLKVHIANNRLHGGIPGFRIRIFSQSGQTARQKANDARTAFMKNFPQTEAYLRHNDPNFQILVGNFRTETEARREKKQIEKMFPSAFIVSDIIEIPK